MPDFRGRKSRVNYPLPPPPPPPPNRSIQKKKLFLKRMMIEAWLPHEKGRNAVIETKVFRFEVPVAVILYQGFSLGDVTPNKYLTTQ